MASLTTGEMVQKPGETVHMGLFKLDNDERVIKQEMIIYGH